MWRSIWKPSFIIIPWTALVVAVLYVAFRMLDPLPPRRFAIAAGIAGSSYDSFARQYARILARSGVTLEVRNYSGAIEHFDVLRDDASGVQAALTTFGFTQPDDADILYSLGGISDSAIFIFYRNVEPVTRFTQFKGKRVSIGMSPTASRTLMLDVLKATGSMDSSIHLLDLDYAEAIDEVIAGHIDAAAFPFRLEDSVLRRALAAPDVRLMNVAQAEAISKTVAGLKHVVLSRGLISLANDVPDVDTDLLAVRNRVLVRKDLHPALQYLLLEAMREVHRPSGPFNRQGEFPAEQPNDLTLSPEAQAFYRSGPSFLQRYTSFWLTSLLNRVVFFVIPIAAMLIPLLTLAPRFYRWLNLRHIDRWHRTLGSLERDLEETGDDTRAREFQAKLAEAASSVRSLKVSRSFEADLHRLRVHLRMVQEEVDRLAHAVHTVQ